MYVSAPIISHAATKIRHAAPIISIDIISNTQPFLLLILLFPITKVSKSRISRDFIKPCS